MFIDADITLGTVKAAVYILDDIDAIVGLAYFADLSFIFEILSSDAWVDEGSGEPNDIEENDDDG
jgi:hypothetical protein